MQEVAQQGRAAGMNAFKPTLHYTRFCNAARLTTHPVLLRDNLNQLGAQVGLEWRDKKAHVSENAVVNMLSLKRSHRRTARGRR